MRSGPWWGTGDVTDLDEQPGRTGGTDAMKSEQAGAGGGHELGELLVRFLLAPVGLLQVGHHLQRDTLAGLAHDVTRSDTGQDLAGLCRGQVFLGSTGHDLQQQCVQLAHDPGVVLPDPAAPIDQ